MSQSLIGKAPASWSPSVAPTARDPLGQRAPDPGTDASFARGLAQLVDERIDVRLRGRASTKFDGVADMELVHELIARGWAVYKPRAASENPDG